MISVSEEPPNIPDRPDDGHKGTFGKVVIIGGSVGMSGSVCLAGKAALRAGSGLVTVAVPSAIQPIVSSFEPSYMTSGMPCSPDGELASTAAEGLAQLLKGTDAVAAGPGMRQSPGSLSLIRKLLRETAGPLVLDADALNLMAAEGLLHDVDCCAASQKQQRVLTPHPGEFSRLSGLTLQEISQNPAKTAAEFAAKHQLVVVLKGHRTVVTDGGRVFRNSTGNSGMATGGSGDVLTGIIASLLGQKMSAFDAACLGVWVHGRSGDLAAAALSKRGMIASDLLSYLPAAWISLESR